MLGEFGVGGETAVRMMIYEIRARNPDAVRFAVTPGDVRSILLCMATERYDTVMYAYGHAFLLEVLRLHEECERYDACAEMKRQIERHNDAMGDDRPTRADDRDDLNEQR